MASCFSKAQYAAFVKSGKIRYDRSVNTFAAMNIFLRETKQVPEDQIPAFMQKYRTTAPQFWKDSFDLFSTVITAYISP